MLLHDLEAVLISRRDQPPAGSYTATLLADPELIQRKIMEEAFELCLELGRTDRSPERTAEEAADVIYHLLVGLVSVNVRLDAVLAVLVERSK